MTKPLYNGVTPDGESNKIPMSDEDYLAHVMEQTRYLGGVKHDTNKAPWHLLSVTAMDEMLKVLQHGEGKYTAHNWRGGFQWSRLISAAARHLFAFLRGEDRDPKTGCLHTAHVMCCGMFLTEHVLRRLGHDDRFKE